MDCGCLATVESSHQMHYVTESRNRVRSPISDVRTCAHRALVLPFFCHHNESPKSCMLHVFVIECDGSEHRKIFGSHSNKNLRKAKKLAYRFDCFDNDKMNMNNSKLMTLSWMRLRRYPKRIIDTATKGSGIQEKLFSWIQR